MAELPGKEFAEEHGYVLHHYSGARTSATYIKSSDSMGVLHLTCRSDGTASLEKVLGMVVCSVGSFSYPNRNFMCFEDALAHVQIVDKLPGTVCLHTNRIHGEQNDWCGDCGYFPLPPR